jgi:Family of unknown function (DUF6491)
MQVTALQEAIVALLMASTIACAATARLPGKPGCFSPADVTEGPRASWSEPNDRTLVIRRPENAYLIELSRPVLGLSFWRNISFDDLEHSGEICGDGRDYLIVPGHEPSHILITAVRELSPADAASLFAEPKQVHGK